VEYFNSGLLLAGIILSIYYGYQLELGEPTNRPLSLILLGFGLGITITSLIVIGIEAI
jgi:hypothetical protein